MAEHALQRDDIIVVEWQDGKYAGKRQPAVQARNIIEPKLVDIGPGTAVKIKMGKSASAKIWNAVFVSKLDELDELDDEAKAPTKPPRTKKKPEVKILFYYNIVMYNYIHMWRCCIIIIIANLILTPTVVFGCTATSRRGCSI